MAKKYRVISETYWDGVQLRKEGETVEVDTDLVQVAWDSRTLEPIGDSPVFEKVKDGEPKVTPRRPKARKPLPTPAPALVAPSGLPS